MGLDITAYHRPTLLGPADEHPILTGEIDDPKAVDDFWGNHVITYLSPHFPHAAEGLETCGAVVDPEHSWTRACVYDISSCTEHSWRAGSYFGYGDFRSFLALLGGYVDKSCWADPDAYRDRPFFELVHFADNEGTLGPVAARNLLLDFREYRTQFRDSGAATWAVEVYDEWIKGLALAADDGFLDFH